MLNYCSGLGIETLAGVYCLGSSLGSTEIGLLLLLSVAEDFAVLFLCHNRNKFYTTSAKLSTCWQELRDYWIGQNIVWPDFRDYCSVYSRYKSFVFVVFVILPSSYLQFQADVWRLIKTFVYRMMKLLRQHLP